eukprot:2078731-Alexandrium_andersonii.AAC.1
MAMAERPYRWEPPQTAASEQQRRRKQLGPSGTDPLRSPDFRGGGVWSGGSPPPPEGERDKTVPS